MKVLILGANGMLGHAVARDLARDHDVTATLRRDRTTYEAIFAPLGVKIVDRLEIAPRFEAVRAMLTEHRPDVVINCIGIVKQSSLAKNEEASRLINSELPRALAQMVGEASGHLIHLSTDCVFSGKRGGYCEADTPDPVDVYGATKLAGEVISPNASILRTSFIGPELDHKLGLFEWFRANRGGQVRGYAKAIFSGLTTIEMCEVIRLTIARRADLSGIWHVGSNAISKFDLLSLINETMDLKIAISEDTSFVCDRSLDSTAFRNATGYAPPDWPTMIRDVAISLNGR